MAYLVVHEDDKYWPRQIDEIDGPGTSWLNEPDPGSH
jgi:hypothetical protein